MTKLGIDITYRTCEVDGVGYLFHCWEQVSQIFEPSPMIGGHPGGTVAGIYGLLEDSDGRIYRVEPHRIRFTDGKAKEYCLGGENERD